MNTHSLLLTLATLANDGGRDGGGSNFIRFAGVDVGLLLFSDPPRSNDMPALRLLSTGEAERELLFEFPFGFFFFTSISESLLSELSSLDESGTKFFF